MTSNRRRAVFPTITAARQHAKELKETMERHGHIVLGREYLV